VILLDTNGLLANYDQRDRHHADAARILARPQRRSLSPFVLAELDDLINRTGGQKAEMTVLNDVARGSYELEPFTAEDVNAASAVIAYYADLRLGLADASLVVLAHRHQCIDILTLYERHFRAVLGPDRTPFRLLPADVQD